MKKFRTLKLLIGAMILTSVGAFIQSCRPVVQRCYKPAIPVDEDTTEYKTIRNSCYDMPAEPVDTTQNK